MDSTSKIYITITGMVSSNYTLPTSTAYDFGKKGRLIPRIQDFSTQGK